MIAFRSGIRPLGKFSTKWYDRAIRAGGAGLILAMIFWVWSYICEVVLTKPAFHFDCCMFSEVYKSQRMSSVNSELC